MYLTSHALPPEDDEPDTELRNGDTHEEPVPGVTITAKGEHSSHTTGLNECIHPIFALV